MIERMKDDGPKNWVVYMLRCEDGSLYTGITNALVPRLKKHCAGRGAAYTKTHRPTALVYQEVQMSRSAALVREAQLKRLPRPRKEKLIESYEAVLIETLVAAPPPAP